MRSKNTVDLGNGIVLTATSTQAKQVAAMVRSFHAQDAVKAQESVAFESGVLVGLDVMAQTLATTTEKTPAKRSAAVLTALAEVFTLARAAIVDELSAKERKEWDALGTDGKAPTRVQLQAGKAKLTGRARAIFNALENSYPYSSKIRTILSETVEHTKTMAAPLSSFLKVERVAGKDLRGISATELYRAAFDCKLSGGTTANVERKRGGKGTGGRPAAKAKTVKDILTQTREELLKIGQLALANAIVTVAARAKVKIRKATQTDVEAAQGKSKLAK